MRRRGLRTAVAKLEAKARLRHAKRLVIFTLQPEANAGEIIGFSDLRDTVDRLWPDSDLGAFAMRAAKALGGARVLSAVYPAPAPLEAPTAAVEAPRAQPAQVEGAAMDYYRNGWLGLG
jgi:hypothetical protein